MTRLLKTLRDVEKEILTLKKPGQKQSGESAERERKFAARHSGRLIEKDQTG